MRILYTTCSGANYMAPPQLADEQINCGPFFRNRQLAGRYLSLETPRGEYDLSAVASRLPEDQQPDAVVCLVDASWFNTPRNLAAFKCPRVALVADTHHMNKPITGMIQYLLSEPFDRIVFLYTRHHWEFFREAGLKNLFWYPGLTFPHADQVVHAARREERQNRIALIGQAGSLHQRRLRMAGALAASGAPLIFRETSQREALDFYGSSLIGFNATANSDLNLRVFEIMSTGAMMLMDRLAPESGFPSLWQDGRHYVGYDNAAELVEKARHYSAHPEQARAIGAAGAQWFDTHFNARRRQQDFQSLVFDGRANPLYVLNPPRKPLLSGFANNANHFLSGLRTYEVLQKLHSKAEEVTILVDETVPAGFKALCDTLPRLRVVRRVAENQMADCFVTSAARAAALTSLDAPRIWCWDATPEQMPALSARFTQAGLVQLRDEVALYGLPEPATLVDKLAADARKHLMHCDFNGAFELARRALTEQPGSIEACLIMAELALEGGKPDLFARMIDRARTLAPDEPRIPLLELSARVPELRQRPAERLLAVVLRHVSGSELAAARTVANRALALDGKLPAAWFWLGQISINLSEKLEDIAQAREFGCALRYLRTAAELASRRPDYWLELGAALRRGGLLSEAVRAYERALELEPSHTSGWLHLAETLLTFGAAERAAGAAQRGLEQAPGNTQLQLWLGHALKRQGRLAEALVWHTRALTGGDTPVADRRGRRRVVFVVQHGPSWPCTESVWRAFAADPEWETVILALPYTHPFYNDAQDDTNAIFDFLTQRGIPFVRREEFDLSPGCADVVFLQNPYDITRPLGWRTTDFLRASCRLAYVPYGIEIGGGERNATWQFNQQLQQMAWAVFARSERHRAMFARHCLVGAAHVHVTGHPKMDAQSDLAAHRDAELTAFAAGRPVALWNPQFDIHLNGTAFGGGFSTFLRWHEWMIEEFARRPAMAFIIRPHPLFFGALEDRGIFTRSQVQAWLDRCATAGNILIDRRPSYLPGFAAADAMLSDASSFLLEFTGTGKPLLYLHNPHGPSLNEDGAFIREHCATAETEGEIACFLDDVAARRDPSRERRMAAYRDYMHRPEEGSGVAIKRCVDERLREESEHAPVVRANLPAPAAETEEERRKRTTARAFWAACTDTHLGSKEYYRKASEALARRLPALLSPEDRVIDLGCGNGEMALLAAPHCREVHGYDISPALIAQAKNAARTAGLGNARFSILDLEQGLPIEPAEVILCLGVFSCVHDDAKWRETLARFARILPEGGVLILRETVSTGPRRHVRYPNGYYACYRPSGTYLAAVRESGFTPTESELLQAGPEDLENHLWVFRRVAVPAAVAVSA